MNIFGKKNEPSKDDLAARLNQYVTQPAPAVPPSEPETSVEPQREDQDDESLDYEDSSIDTAVQARIDALSRGAARVDERDDDSVSSRSATNYFTDIAPMAIAGESRPSFFPKRPASLEETGIARSFVTDLILRSLYAANELMGIIISERVALPFAEVVGPILETLRHEQAVEIKSQRGLGDAGYLYGITDKGILRARDSMEKLTYVGPAPVRLEDYVTATLAQSVRSVVVTQENIREAFRDLIINDEVLDEVGPAVNSGSSMFLFGYPGNGKTSIAERITKLLGDYIFVPNAVEVDGAVIKVFDSINHTPVEETLADGQPRRPDWDTRWVKIERPVVMVGGELTMSSLDLLYNESGKYYEAPLQMKANGGMFLIDDFGRQMIRPQDLLNRWIVPLEKRVDFLTLVTGKKISIPFEQLIVFSTNLDPKDLVDDAFLRRIKFKINVLDPDEDQFRAIFKLMCNRRSVPYVEEAFRYMLDTYYAPTGRPLRMCQPRDLVDQIISIAKYKMVPAEMTMPLIDRACQTYFVTL
ncbi:MAG: ATPase [Chloroflexi bacterium]|nr:ATPase [Chloroflexota bacterium]